MSHLLNEFNKQEIKVQQRKKVKCGHLFVTSRFLTYFDCVGLAIAPKPAQIYTLSDFRHQLSPSSVKTALTPKRNTSLSYTPSVT